MIELKKETKIRTSVSLSKATTERLWREKEEKGVNMSHTIEKALLSYWGAKNGNKN